MIKLGPFAGEYPRAQEHMRNSTNLEKAENVDLAEGSIQPWPRACATACTPAQVYQTLIPDSATCVCSGFTTKRQWLRYVMDECDLYLGLINGELMVADDEMFCADTWCPICPPEPVSPAYGDSADGCDDQGNYYVYTYVNQFGFEGPPSAPIFTGVQSVGGSVIGFAAPPAGHCITAINVYRADTGPQTGDANMQVNGDFFLVDSIATGAAQFNDNKDLLEAGAPLMTREYMPPPTGLTALAILPNGSVAVSKGKRIYISEPPIASPTPHAFTRNYDLQIRDDVVAMVNDDEGVFVATTSRPGTISWSPTQGGGNIRWNEFNTHFPCVAPETLIAVDGLGYYASDEGLIQMNRGTRSTGAVARNFTKEKITKRQWCERVDAESVSAAMDGRIFMTGPRGVEVIYYGSVAQSDPAVFTGNSYITFMGRPNDLLVTTGKSLRWQDGLSMYELDLCLDILNRAVYPYDVEVSVWTEPRRVLYRKIKPQLRRGSSFGTRIELLKAFDNSTLSIFDKTVSETGIYSVRASPRYDRYLLRATGTRIIDTIEIGTSARELADQ